MPLSSLVTALTSDNLHTGAIETIATGDDETPQRQHQNPRFHQPGTILGKITASGKYVAHDPAASNGTQMAAAVLWDSVDASGGDKNAVVLIRGPAIVNQYEISIPGTPTAPQIAAAHAALLTLGILVR